MASLSLMKAVQLVDDSEVDNSTTKYTTAVNIRLNNSNGSQIVSRMSLQLMTANYTSVAVSFQASLDGTNFWDVGTELTGAGGTDIATLGDGGPYEYVRIRYEGTLSGSADTMEIWQMEEHVS